MSSWFVQRKKDGCCDRFILLSCTALMSAFSPNEFGRLSRARFRNTNSSVCIDACWLAIRLSFHTMSRSPKPFTVARLNDLILGSFSHIQPSETVDHLIRYLGTWSGSELVHVVYWSDDELTRSGSTAASCSWLVAPKLSQVVLLISHRLYNMP